VLLTFEIPVSKRSRKRKEFIQECIAKARFLNRFGLIAFLVFAVAAYMLYPNWQSSRILFFASVIMIVVSIAFFFYMRKAMRVFEHDPTDEDIVKWGDFLELYYVPKYFTRKRRNPFIVEDDEDDED